MGGKSWGGGGATRLHVVPAQKKCILRTHLAEYTFSRRNTCIVRAIVPENWIPRRRCWGSRVRRAPPADPPLTPGRGARQPPQRASGDGPTPNHLAGHADDQPPSRLAGHPASQPQPSSGRPARWPSRWPDNHPIVRAAIWPASDQLAGQPHQPAPKLASWPASQPCSGPAAYVPSWPAGYPTAQHQAS